jgi:hypothetical protein
VAGDGRRRGEEQKQGKPTRARRHIHIDVLRAHKYIKLEAVDVYSARIP